MSQDRTTVINSDTDIHKKLTDISFRIELFFQGKEYEFEREDLPVYIGRSADECQITINSSTVSRRHCSFVVQNNQIGLLDKSTNGTHIRIGRADSVLIKNSFYPLSSQGNISVGEPIDSNTENVIYFRICPNKEKTAKK